MNEILLDTLQVMNTRAGRGWCGLWWKRTARSTRSLRGQVRVRVQSPIPLTEALREQLQQAVSSYTGKTAKLEESVEPSLIGGLVVQVADRKIDTSVVKEIQGLRAATAGSGVPRDS